MMETWWALRKRGTKEFMTNKHIFQLGPPNAPALFGSKDGAKDVWMAYLLSPSASAWRWPND